MAEDESGTHKRLKNLRDSFFGPRIAAHNGHIVKLMGDGMLVEFASVVDSVSCAIELQGGLAERQAEVAQNRRILLRIGINIGDVIFDDGDIYGDGVNVAARLEPLAEPGGIYVSRAVFEYSRGKVDHEFELVGEHQLKNIPEPVEVYRVALGTGPGTTALRRKRRLGPLIGAAAAVIAAVGTIGWYQPWRVAVVPPVQQTGPALSSLPSLAVLPFDNLSASADDDYFAEGMTDDLITDLSKISGLMVIARNTVFTYKNKAVDVREVGRELGVRYVLEGSLRRAGNRVRINAQLIDSQTGSHLWADRFDREASDIFAVQDEVIRHIVDVLAVQLSTSEKERVGRLPTENLEAYDYYLRAEQAVRSGFRPKFRIALHLYNKATELDPSFARAFAAQARAEAYILRANYDDVLALPIARKNAYEHAGRALELDPDAALPFAVLAELQTVDGRHEEAVASARKAVAIAPGVAEAYAALSLALTYDGRHPEAISAFETALKLDPHLPLGVRLDACISYMLNGQAERAVELLEAARVESSNVDDFHAMLAAAYALLGRTEDARAAAEETARIGPNVSLELSRVRLAHFRRKEDLDRIIDAFEKGGMQKWPFGFVAGGRERLTGEAIETIAIGKTWQGQLDGVGPGILQIDPSGNLAIRTVTLFATGKAEVSDNSLCINYQGLTLGRTVCGPVYRNSDGSADGEYPYTYVNPNMVFHFAMRE
jgi:TolB-like protein/tetratricopeptide (TPR) repeat protein